MTRPTHPHSMKPSMMKAARTMLVMGGLHLLGFTAVFAVAVMFAAVAAVLFIPVMLLAVFSTAMADRAAACSDRHGVPLMALGPDSDPRCELARPSLPGANGRGLWGGSDPHVSFAPRTRNLTSTLSGDVLINA